MLSEVTASKGKIGLGLVVGSEVIGAIGDGWVGCHQWFDARARRRVGLIGIIPYLDSVLLSGPVAGWKVRGRQGGCAQVVGTVVGWASRFRGVIRLVLRCVWKTETLPDPNSDQTKVGWLELGRQGGLALEVGVQLRRCGVGDGGGTAAPVQCFIWAGTTMGSTEWAPWAWIQLNGLLPHVLWAWVVWAFVLTQDCIMGHEVSILISLFVYVTLVVCFYPFVDYTGYVRIGRTWFGSSNRCQTIPYVSKFLDTLHQNNLSITIVNLRESLCVCTLKVQFSTYLVDYGCSRVGSSPPIFFGTGSWSCFWVLLRQSLLFRGLDLDGGLYGVVSREFFLSVVGYHMICVLGCDWHQLSGRHYSSLVLLTTSRLLVAMATSLLASMVESVVDLFLLLFYCIML